MSFLHCRQALDSSNPILVSSSLLEVWVRGMSAIYLGCEAYIAHSVCVVGIRLKLGLVISTSIRSDMGALIGRVRHIGEGLRFVIPL